jgi:hypothetical protein
MDIGDAYRRRRESSAVDKANSVIDGLNNRVTKAEPLAQDYLSWLAKKKQSATQFSLEIFAEMRPDLRDKNKLPLDQKRVFNLHLIAWTEWWAESVRGGDLLAKEKAPKLRGLSAAMMQADFQAQAASKALADIADRLELTQGMSNPRDWVKKRVNEMWRIAKWKTNEPSVPIYSSLAPYPPVSQQRVDESGGKFDVMDHNLYGIDEMMMK